MTRRRRQRGDLPNQQIEPEVQTDVVVQNPTKHKLNLMNLQMGEDGLVESTTITKALELVEKSAATTEEWRSKSLGLQFVLLGLAEVNALRVKSLSAIVYHLEQKVFDPTTFETLEPRQQMSMYKVATQSLNETSEYVKDTLKHINWAEVENNLVSLQVRGNKPGGNAEDKQLADVAGDLLNNIGVDHGEKNDIMQVDTNAPVSRKRSIHSRRADSEDMG